MLLCQALKIKGHLSEVCFSAQRTGHTYQNNQPHLLQSLILLLEGTLYAVNTLGQLSMGCSTAVTSWGDQSCPLPSVPVPAQPRSVRLGKLQPCVKAALKRGSTVWSWDSQRLDIFWIPGHLSFPHSQQGPPFDLLFSLGLSF